MHDHNSMNEENEKPLVSKLGIVIDLFISILFFLFMQYVLADHVPFQDPLAVNLVAGMSALCMTGVFWIATNMFRVTLVDHKRRRKEK